LSIIAAFNEEMDVSLSMDSVRAARGFIVSSSPLPSLARELQSVATVAAWWHHSKVFNQRRSPKIYVIENDIASRGRIAAHGLY